MKQAGCEVPDYMLKLKSPSKKLKRLREKKAPKRSKISTGIDSAKLKKHNDAEDSNEVTHDGQTTNNGTENKKSTSKKVKGEKKAKKMFKKPKK